MLTCVFMYIFALVGAIMMNNEIAKFLLTIGYTMFEEHVVVILKYAVSGLPKNSSILNENVLLS